jgi:hypothetical protein
MIMKKKLNKNAINSYKPKWKKIQRSISSKQNIEEKNWRKRYNPIKVKKLDPIPYGSVFKLYDLVMISG